MSADALFQPFRLKSLALKNRIVMAPMTRSLSPGGVPPPEVAAYYARRAAAGVGLILSEGTAIARPAAANDPKVPHFWGQEALAGWKRVIEAVHAEGGKMAPQLWHVGAVPGQGTWTPPGPPESPSGLVGPDRPNGVAMTEQDIADTIAAYASAAADAKRLGFDAVELHGAHGYLIDQFFWEGANLRTDRWGGASLPERCRFAVEILKSVRAAVGPDFPVIIRLSQWKMGDFGYQLAKTPDEMAAWLEPLADAGADAFHCSQRRFWEAEFPNLQGEGSDLNMAGWAKKLTGKVSITVGSVGLSGDFIGGFGGEVSHPASLDELVRRLERGDFDLVAVGRALLADPQWATKVKDGRAGDLKDFTREAMATLS